MKISIVTLSALMISIAHVHAQTKPLHAKPVKQTPQNATQKKQATKPKTEKTAIAKDSVKPINKSPDHYYCPPCGMG